MNKNLKIFKIAAAISERRNDPLPQAVKKLTVKEDKSYKSFIDKNVCHYSVQKWIKQQPDSSFDIEIEDYGDGDVTRLANFDEAAFEDILCKAALIKILLDDEESVKSTQLAKSWLEE